MTKEKTKVYIYTRVSTVMQTVQRKADLDDRLYKLYDKIEDTESLLIAARAKKQAIETEKRTGGSCLRR